jgi:hypothetical protein
VDRVKVDLEPAEYCGLAALAERELRPLSGQLRHLLREELKRRGLLPSDEQASAEAGDAA